MLCAWWTSAKVLRLTVTPDDTGDGMACAVCVSMTATAAASDLRLARISASPDPTAVPSFTELRRLEEDVPIVSDKALNGTVSLLV